MRALRLVAVLGAALGLAVASSTLGLAKDGAVISAPIKAWPEDVVMGKADAPITIYEYSSLTCPHCASFHLGTFPKLKAEWIDTGKAKLVFRDLPWDNGALAAAMISHCAGDRYFAFVDTYFAAQASWAHSSDPMAGLTQIAKLGGMSDAAVKSCLQRADLMTAVMARKKEALDTLGIESTPSFIIKGKVASGNMTYDEFVKLLQ